VKSELDIVFLPDAITCCVILYNVLLEQSYKEVEQLLQVLQCEGLEGNVTDENGELVENEPREAEDGPALASNGLRSKLAIHVAG
jgi:hypothetical protein